MLVPGSADCTVDEAVAGAVFSGDDGLDAELGIASSVFSINGKLDEKKSCFSLDGNPVVEGDPVFACERAISV